MRSIFSILFIVISVVLFFTIINPLYGEVKQMRTDVATYNVALNNSTELQKTRDSLIDLYKNIKAEDKERLAHFLPSTIDNIKLILEIEKIANLHGMPIKNFQFDTKSLENPDDNATNNETVVIAKSDPEDYLDYGVFPMEFIIEGKYDTFVSFLEDLEHNLRLVDIKSISFTVPTASTTTTGTASNPNIYDYTLKVETYWLK